MSKLGTLFLVSSGATLGLPIKQEFAVLVNSELGDDNLGRVNANVDGGAVNLLAGDALDVDDPLAAIDLDHFALAALVGSPHHLHLVVLANRNGPHVVLRPEIGRERRAHQDATHARRSGEVSLAALSTA